MLLPTVRTLSGHEFVAQLVEYVQKNEAAITSGEVKFTLQPQSLQYLASKFPPAPVVLSSVGSGSVNGGGKDKGPKREKVAQDLVYLYNFCQQLEVLKLTSQGRRMVTEGLLQLNFFACLTTLEVNKVHVKVVQGLDQLQHHLVRLRWNNSLYNYSDLFVDGVRPPNPTGKLIPASQRQPEWSTLRFVDCSHNFADQLDESFQYLKGVEMLDVSFNRLTSVNNLHTLTKLQYLNLGFNMISSMENCAAVIGNVSTLVLRNNQLNSVRGIERLMGLEQLDLRDNCLWDLKDLRLLADLPFLSSVWLQSNPVSYEAVYRISVFSYFNRNRHTIILDGDKPSMTEQLLIESITDQLLPIRAEPSPLREDLVPATPISIRRQKKSTRKEVVIEDLSENRASNGKHNPAGRVASVSVSTAQVRDDEDDYDDDAASLDEDHFDNIPASLEAAATEQLRANLSPLKQGGLLTPYSPKPQSPVVPNPPRATTPPGRTLTPLAKELFPAEPSPPETGASPSKQTIVNLTIETQSDPISKPASGYGSPRVPRSARSRIAPALTPNPNAVSQSSEEFRQKVEALRSEAGPNWLRVLTEMQTPTADLLHGGSITKGGPAKPMTDDERLATIVAVPSTEASAGRRPSGESTDSVSTDASSQPKPTRIASLPPSRTMSAVAYDSTDDIPSLLVAQDMLAVPTTVSDASSVADIPGAAAAAGEHDDNDDGELKLTCTICGEQIPMDILEEHSQDCLLRSQAPLAAKYRCMMCARPVQVINPRKIECNTCKSLYVVAEAGTVQTAATAAAAAAAAPAAFEPSSMKRSMSLLLVTKSDDNADVYDHWISQQPLMIHNNLLLFFDIKVFQQEDERVVAFFRASFVTPKAPREQGAYVLLSNKQIYCLVRKTSINPISADEPEKTIRVAHAHSLDSIVQVDVGQSHQYLNFYFNNNVLPSCSYILRDAMLSHEFIRKLAEFMPAQKSLQSMLTQDHGWLQANIRSQVLSRADHAVRQQDPVKTYSLAFIDGRPISLVLTQYWLYLCEERLAYINEDNRAGPQFAVKGQRAIADVTSIDLASSATATILFEDDSADELLNNDVDGSDDLPPPTPSAAAQQLSRSRSWELTFASVKSRDVVADAVSVQWRDQFKVALSVTKAL